MDEQYNPVNDYLASVRQYVAAHPNVEYVREEFIYTDEDGKVAGGCLVGLGILARMPDDSVEEIEANLDAASKGSPYFGLLYKLYPGLGDYRIELPEGVWNYSAGCLWDDNKFSANLNSLNVFSSMDLQEALEYVSTHASKVEA